MTASARAAAGALLLLLSSAAAFAQQQYRTRLDTVPIDFRTQAATTGNGVVSATLAGDELTLEGSFEGLASPATEAWLHVGAATGARGPQAHALTVTHAPSGQLGGTLRLSRREIEALKAGRLYVQIHSQSAPEGNLWGWLLAGEQDR